jgi:DNA-binding NarL/FixJ family response regulator
MRKIDPIQAAHQAKPFEAMASHDSCNPPTIGVYVVVENRLLREILVRLLRRQGDIELIGEGGAGDTDSTAVVTSGCDVALVDFIDTEWISEIRQSHSPRRAIRTVVLGMDADSGLFLESVRCGVTGYLLKDASTVDVLSAVRLVHRGEASCPPQLCTILMRTVAQLTPETRTHTPTSKLGLTLRQQSLISLVAKGLTNKEIAKECHLSEYTVKNHVTRILKRLHVEKRGEAVDAVRQSGLELSA